jgi:transposase
MKALKPHQCATIVTMITDRCPDQLKLPFALWTREAVRDLIAQRYGIILALNTVGLYLKRWGFTPQKPLRRAYQRQDSQVQKWLKDTYPAIAKRAHQEKAEIHWGDEAGFRSDHQTGTSYSPKGQTPVIEVTAKRFRTNMISTISNKGTLRFMVFDENFTVDVLLDFLERLIRKAPQKIFLILDNHKVHHAYRVRQWVEDHKDKIEIFYLPPYSPELNPDERLNADLKYAIGSKVPARTKAKLKAAASGHMSMLEASPDRVMAYFQDPRVKYAAS